MSFPGSLCCLKEKMKVVLSCLFPCYTLDCRVEVSSITRKKNERDYSFLSDSREYSIQVLLEHCDPKNLSEEESRERKESERRSQGSSLNVTNSVHVSHSRSQEEIETHIESLLYCLLRKSLIQDLFVKKMTSTTSTASPSGTITCAGEKQSNSCSTSTSNSLTATATLIHSTYPTTSDTTPSQTTSYMFGSSSFYPPPLVSLFNFITIF